MRTRKLLLIYPILRHPKTLNSQKNNRISKYKIVRSTVRRSKDTFLETPITILRGKPTVIVHIYALLLKQKIVVLDMIPPLQLHRYLTSVLAYLGRRDPQLHPLLPRISTAPKQSFKHKTTYLHRISQSCLHFHTDLRPEEIFAGTNTSNCYNLPNLN